MLNYIKREPKVTIENPPVLILLHGYGSNEKDLFSFADELPDDFLIISAQAPYELGYGAYSWYTINFDSDNNKFSDLDEARKSVGKIVDFIDAIKERYNTNPEKTFLLGFSQGAILSYATTLNYPNKVQYVLALSGYVNEDLLPKTTLSEVIETDYYISHGSSDQVIPVTWARKVQELLSKFNVKCGYSEYPVGHGVAPQNFYHLRNWILERL